jgi:hypothetical protein
MEKLLNVFPDLNADWLITGHGIMLKPPSEGSPGDTINSVESGSGKKSPVIKTDKTLKNANSIEIQAHDKERRVEKIVFFYNDMTFSVYLPD